MKQILSLVAVYLLMHIATTGLSQNPNVEAQTVLHGDTLKTFLYPSVDGMALMYSVVNRENSAIRQDCIQAFPDGRAFEIKVVSMPLQRPHLPPGWYDVFIQVNPGKRRICSTIYLK